MTMTRLGETLRDGMAAVQARQFDRARLLLEHAAVDAPGDPRVWYWIAMASESGAAAIPLLRRVLALDPAHAQARAALVKLLIAQALALAAQDRAQARALVTDAAALAPEYDAVWVALASLSETPADRVSALRHAVKIHPGPELRSRLHDSLVHHAVMLARTSHTVEARGLFREAAELDPEDPRVWQALARVAETPAEAVRALRELVRLAPDQPAHRAALEKALAAEANALAASGHRAAARAPARREPAADKPRVAPAATPSAATIMVVDDSPTIRKILGLTLERAGYTVVAEPDGERAVARLAEIVPDLILLDISMPKLDGYEVCKRIRKDPRTAHVPVVMLSGKDGFFDKVKGRMVGASEYLTKPFEAPAVLAVIGKHCRRGAEAVHG